VIDFDGLGPLRWGNPRAVGAEGSRGGRWGLSRAFEHAGTGDGDDRAGRWRNKDGRSWRRWMELGLEGDDFVAVELGTSTRGCHLLTGQKDRKEIRKRVWRRSLRALSMAQGGADGDVCP